MLTGHKTTSATAMGDAHMSSSDNVGQQNHVTHKKNRKKASSSGLHIATSESCSPSVSVQASNVKEDSFVLSLDVGTTTIRAHVYDQTATRRGTGSRNVSSILRVFCCCCVVCVCYNSVHFALLFYFVLKRVQSLFCFLSEDWFVDTDFCVKFFLPFHLQIFRRGRSQKNISEGFKFLHLEPRSWEREAPTRMAEVINWFRRREVGWTCNPPSPLAAPLFLEKVMYPSATFYLFHKHYFQAQLGLMYPVWIQSYFIYYFQFQIHLIFPQPGWVEIDEYEIWQQAQDVIKDALAGINAILWRTSQFILHLYWFHESLHSCINTSLRHCTKCSYLWSKHFEDFLKLIHVFSSVWPRCKSSLKNKHVVFFLGSAVGLKIELYISWMTILWIHFKSVCRFSMAKFGISQAA